MSKIYLITKGDYSDYTVICAYSEKANADTHVAMYGGDIEEFELNPKFATEELVRKGYKWYYVHMNSDFSSNTKLIERLDVYDSLKNDYCFAKEYDRVTFKCSFFAKVLAQSEEVAVKITAEKLRKYLALYPFPQTQEDLRKLHNLDLSKIVGDDR